MPGHPCLEFRDRHAVIELADSGCGQQIEGSRWGSVMILVLAWLSRKVTNGEPWRNPQGCPWFEGPSTIGNAWKLKKQVWTGLPGVPQPIKSLKYLKYINISANGTRSTPRNFPLIEGSPAMNRVHRQRRRNVLIVLAVAFLFSLVPHPKDGVLVAQRGGGRWWCWVKQNLDMDGGALNLRNPNFPCTWPPYVRGEPNFQSLVGLLQEVPLDFQPLLTAS